MGVPTSEVGYTPATPRREDHEVHKGHVVTLDQKKKKEIGLYGQLNVKICTNICQCGNFYTFVYRQRIVRVCACVIVYSLYTERDFTRFFMTCRVISAGYCGVTCIVEHFLLLLY